MKQAMNDTQQKALARAFALKKEGKTWADIEKALEREGFKDSKGNSYTAGNLKAWYSKLRGKAPTTERKAPTRRADKVDTAKGREQPDFLTREEVHTMRAELEKQLIELIETKLGVE